MLYERGTAPVFSIVIGARVGGSDETPGETGVSHMFEHMAFKGTDTVGTKDYAKEKKLLAEMEQLALASDSATKLDEAQQQRWTALQKQLDALWIRGAMDAEYSKRGETGMNATTDSELTMYFMNMPRSAFEFTLWMESERLLNPVMREFYKERDVVMEERRMRFEDDPGGKLYEALLGVSFLGHPYRNPVIGYPYDLQRLTATKSEAFRKRFYVPSNLALGIVGNVNPEKDLVLIEKYFGRLPAGPVPSRPFAIEPPQIGQREVVIEFPSSPQFSVAYKKPVYPDPDVPALDVLWQVLAGSSVSPLHEELVKKQQVAASIGYGDMGGEQYPNLAAFIIIPKAPHTNLEVLDAFDKVITRFKRQGPSATQMEIAKRAIAATYLLHLKSSMSIAKDFVESELLFGNWKTSFEQYPALMAVTKDDVLRVARKYLITKTRTIGRVERSEK